MTAVSAADHEGDARTPTASSHAGNGPAMVAASGSATVAAVGDSAVPPGSGVGPGGSPRGWHAARVWAKRELLDPIPDAPPAEQTSVMCSRSSSAPPGAGSEWTPGGSVLVHRPRKAAPECGPAGDRGSMSTRPQVAARAHRVTPPSRLRAGGHGVHTLGDRLAREGATALSDLELLALLVGHGAPGARVWKLVRALAARADLSELALLDHSGLLETPGVRPAEAAVVNACFELARRLYRPDQGPPTLSQASDVHAVARDLELARREYFIAFYLDARNRVLARDTISVGSLNASIVHPREVFAPALERRAASIIIVHNHPSGDPEPSDDDLLLTRRLVEAGVLLGVEVLDHLVIGHGAYVSLKSRGLM